VCPSGQLVIPSQCTDWPNGGAIISGQHLHIYLRIENAEGYVLITVYLFIYLYACYSHNKKSFKPNRMKFAGMIAYYPGTIWLDFGIDRVKGQGQGHEKVTIFLNRMKFGGMIGDYPGAIWLDFGIDRVKGQG